MFDDVFKKYITSKNLIFILMFIIFLFLVIKCKDIAVMFFASFVIACSINPIVDKMSVRMSRKAATSIIAVLFLAVFFLVFVPLGIAAAEQVRVFVVKLPHYLDNIDEYVFSLPVLKNFSFLANDADNVMDSIAMSSSEMFAKAVDIGKMVAKALMYLIVSIIIIFNMVSDKPALKNFYLNSFPPNMRKKADEIGDIITEKMGGYIFALLVTTFSVGIVMTLGLFICQVPYALLLGVITGALDIIPVVGPALALLICIIAVYDAGSAALISVISVFIIAQLVENNFVRPYVFSKVMHVHPILIFLFLFIAAEYIGVVGVVFAPALAALFAVLYQELYLKKIK